MIVELKLIYHKGLNIVVIYCKLLIKRQLIVIADLSSSFFVQVVSSII